MTDDALAQARAMLDELTQAAREKRIVPFQLPGQLEAILQMIERAQEEGAAPAPSSGGAADTEAFKHEIAAILSHAFHDLRLPLTNIRGYSDMLANPSMGELSAMQQQFMTTIRANARRLESLLTDVGDMNKLLTGTLKITPKMDMFKNIAMMIEKANRPLAEEAGRALVFDIPSGLPVLNVDGEILAKALNKLVENAVRYTPSQGGQVRVSAAADDNTLHILIQDNGIGMTPEELSRLGTPYFRGDNEAVLVHKGSGLGIPIAYGIIDLLGGSVQVTSQPGQGSAFTVTLAGMS